jgi:ribosomal protein S18 acetylase RimI-like enzyme
MSSSPPEVRAPREDEAEAVAELINAYERELHGLPAVDADEVRRWWAVDVDRKTRVRIVPGGGYADLSKRGRAWNLDVRALDPRAHAALFDWGEAEGGRPLRTWSPAADEKAGARLADRGYRVIRSSFQMAIELDDDPPAPEWPAGIEVRTSEQGEERAVYEAHQEAFEDHWEYVRDPWERWAAHHVGPHADPTLWFLAVDGDQISGLALCRARRGSDPDECWVDELAVRRPWRRRGVATALLLHAFREFRSRGFRQARLGVDAENTTGAVRLYEQVGMTQVRRYDTYELAS